MTASSTEARVRQVMSVVFGRSLADAPVDAEGLWDSLEGINLLFSLQEAFAIELSDPVEWESCGTIAGVVAAIERRSAGVDERPPTLVHESPRPYSAPLPSRLQAPDAFLHSLRPATPADLTAMARIHVHSGTPGLLTDLGEEFLRAYYGRLVASPFGRATVLEISGEVAGFVTTSVQSTRLYRQVLGGRHAIGTAFAVAMASLRHPRIARSFLETVRSVQAVEPGGPIDAEVVSLEVDPRHQGLGLGYVLLATAVAGLREDDRDRPIKTRILADQSEIERLYMELGFKTVFEFRMHGRSWKLMALQGPNTRA
jgi:GNAT superfamily N-acetyltransferase/acyl carrier protein